MPFSHDENSMYFFTAYQSQCGHISGTTDPQNYVPSKFCKKGTHFPEGGIGQNQNFQFSCKKNSDQEVHHFLKHEMIFFLARIKYFFFYDVVKI